MGMDCLMKKAVRGEEDTLVMYGPGCLSVRLDRRGVNKLHSPDIKIFSSTPIQIKATISADNLRKPPLSTTPVLLPPSLLPGPDMTNVQRKQEYDDRTECTAEYHHISSRGCDQNITLGFLVLRLLLVTVMWGVTCRDAE